MLKGILSVISGLAFMIVGGPVAGIMGFSATKGLTESGSAVITFLMQLPTFFNNMLAFGTYLLPSWIFPTLLSIIMLMIAFWIVKLFVNFMSSLPGFVSGGG